MLKVGDVVRWSESNLNYIKKVESTGDSITFRDWHRGAFRIAEVVMERGLWLLVIDPIGGTHNPTHAHGPVGPGNFVLDPFLTAVHHATSLTSDVPAGSVADEAGGAASSASDVSHE